MNTQPNRRMLLTVAAVLVASVALVGCGSDDESALATKSSESVSTTTESTTTTTTTTTTEAPTTTAAPTTAPPTTAAPTATEVLVYPADHTARIALDSYEVSAGQTVTAKVSGFDPGASLGSSFIGNWPPTDMPDPDHFVTYLPDVAVADASGAATVQITIDPVCGQGDCYVVVADGIGPNGIYAGAKLNFKA